MRKQLIWMIAVAVLLPGAAFADNIEDIQFSGGTLTGSSFGFTLAGAAVNDVSSAWTGNVSGANLGSITFTTATNGPWLGFVTGSVVTGTGILPGGTITITGNGSDPNVNGALFTGSFTRGGTWVLGTDSKTGDTVYTLAGYVNGVTGSGSWADGNLSLQLDMGPVVGTTFAGSSTADPLATASGSAILAVPEPGSLSLMGTGLLGLLGAIGRKIKA